MYWRWWDKDRLDLEGEKDISATGSDGEEVLREGEGEGLAQE